MSGLLSDLVNAAKALNAQSAGASLAGRNLANVNNPGYARQRVVLGDRGSVQTNLGTQSTGVEALGVRSLRDRFLDRQVTSERSVGDGLRATQRLLQSAQSALGQGIDGSNGSAGIDDAATTGGGLANALGAFFNRFSSLAASPNDATQKQLVLQGAGALADEINAADGRLAKLQTDLTGQITDGVAQVNDLLRGVADLNGQIGRAELNQPGGAVDLRDQRQAKLEALAGQLGIRSREIPGSHGQIELFTRDAATGAEVTLVDRTTVHGSVTFDGSGFRAGNPPAALDPDTVGGALPALLAGRDGPVADLRADLGRLADQLTASVNAAYNPSGTAGGDFFNPTPGGGRLLELAPGLNATTLKTSGSTGGAGANDLALAVAAVANQTFSVAGGDQIDGTLGGFYSAKVVGGLGGALAKVNTQVEDQELVETSVASQRDAVSGVSTDEEMTDLIKYQRAFEANSRVVSVIDEMLDEIVNRMAR